MGRSGLLLAVVDRLRRLIDVSDRHRRQTHDAAVARALWVRRSRLRVPSPLEPLKRSTGCDADVKAPPVAAHIPFVCPAGVARHLVVQVETLLDQAGSETECHAGVVGELAGQQAERSATDHVRHWFE